MTENITKDEIRAAAKAARRSVCGDDANAKSAAIWKTLSELETYRGAKTVMAYMSAFSEADTSALIKDALAHKRLALPVSDTRTHTITPYRLRSPNDLHGGAYGIQEPPQTEIVPVNEIDAAVIPGIAFDKKGARLGFGKGYYDRFLRDFGGVKIALCYEAQIFDRIPTEKHDVKMDIIITEKRIYDDF